MININIWSTPVMVDLQDYIKVKMLSFFEARDKIAFSKNQAKLEKYNISVNRSFDFIESYELKVWLDKFFHVKIIWNPNGEVLKTEKNALTHQKQQKISVFVS